MAHAARLSLRMQKELKLLVKDPPPGVSLLPFSSTGSSSSFPLTNIEAWIEGPEGTVYSKGIFAIKIQIPERYPFQPPNVTFMTPIYHPNIDNGGRICLDILNLPPKGAWQPSLNISTVLTSIGLLMSEPNPDDGLMCETSREYKYNRQAFDQKARSWTEEYAKAGPGRNNNNVGVLAISSTSTVVESERVEDSSEDPLLYENQGSLMKSHVIGEKLSLKHMAPAERSYTDNKENMAPTRRHLSLSLSRSQSSQKCQNPTAGSSNSVSVSCVLTCDKQDSQMESSEKPLNGNKEQLGQGSKLKEVAIVSDSEESDEEAGRPIARRRLCLSRKQIVKK